MWEINPKGRFAVQGLKLRMHAAFALVSPPKNSAFPAARFTGNSKNTNSPKNPPGHG